MPNSATPTTPSKLAVSNTNNAVKVATSNLFVINEPKVTVEQIIKGGFEDIGGKEIINYTRHDLVNVFYGTVNQDTNISNLSTIAKNFNSTNIISLQTAEKAYFSQFQNSLNNLVVVTPAVVNASQPIIKATGVAVVSLKSNKTVVPVKKVAVQTFKVGGSAKAQR